ncbi:MAG: recombinase RecT [Bacteroidota bacterium]
METQKDIKKSSEDDIPLPFDNIESPTVKPYINEETGELMPGTRFKAKNATNTAPAIIPNTKSAELPKGIPATPFMKLLNTKKNALNNFLGDEKRALVFMSAVVHCMDKIPELGECTHDSLLGAFMECAALDLYPGSAQGDCYVLPYAGKAQFQLGYKGIKTLAFRSGICRLNMEVVYENDKYKETLGTNPKIDHIKPAFGNPRGRAIGAYAAAEVTPGHWAFKSMSEEEIMRVKATSKAAGNKYSPWNSNDPLKTMWGKTALKQLGKVMPTSDKLQRAIYLDNVCERGGYIEGEGQIIEVPFESDENVIEHGKDKKQQMRNKKK